LMLFLSFIAHLKQICLWLQEPKEKTSKDWQQRRQLEVIGAYLSINCL